MAHLFRFPISHSTRFNTFYKFFLSAGISLLLLFLVMALYKGGSIFVKSSFASPFIEEGTFVIFSKTCFCLWEGRKTKGTLLTFNQSILIRKLK